MAEGHLTRTLALLLPVLALVGLALLGGQASAADEEGDAEGRRPVLVAQARVGGIASVAFSPDGRTILSGGWDRVASLWEADTGRLIRRFGGHTDEVQSVAFSASDRRILTSSSDGTVRLWETSTGREIRRFDLEGRGEVRSALSSDGTRLLTARDSIVVLWDAESGQEVRRVVGLTSPVASIALSPDAGRALTASWDETVRLWDTETSKEVGRFEGHEDVVFAAAFSPSGDLVATGSRDRTARLWETATGREVRRVQTKGDGVSAVRFSRDGARFLTVSGPHVELWETATGRKAVLLEDASPVAEFHEPVFGLGVPAVALSPDGTRVLTASPDGDGIRMWDVATGQELGRLEGRALRVLALAISPDGTHVGASFEGDISDVRILDLRTGREVGRFVGHPDAVRAVAFSPDGQLVATGSEDGTVRIWERATGREVRRFEGLTAGVGAVAFAPDGRYVLAGTTAGVRWWDVETGEEAHRSKGWVEALAVSPNGKYALVASSVSFTNDARLFDLGTGQEVLRFEGHGDYVQAVAFSPDGTQVLTGSMDRTARLWETATGRELHRFFGHRGPFFAVAFTSDGRHAVTASTDATVRFWDVATGHEVCAWVFFRTGGWGVVAPDGRFDTDDLDEVPGLHWVMPDEPRRTAPIEIFMRDYYEPRLLARVLAEESFTPVRDISRLNRVQPEVRILSVRPETEDPWRVAVTVEVQSRRRTLSSAQGKALQVSGAEDLRLLRGGRLVAWRDGPLDLDETDRARITFSEIQLPRGVEGDVVFSAYAFNVDRVKSSTTHHAYRLPEGTRGRRGRAYVVAVGIDAFDIPRWDLAYAAADARVLGTTLAASLRETRAFEAVVPVVLTSETDLEGKRTADAARKADVETILRLLAGRPVDAQARARLPGAEQVAAARPEDLVFLSFSTHGVSANGEFYLLPADVSPSDGAGDWLASCISAAELSTWLRPVDAEIAMVVDACQSAASVEREGFKPGPLGSRGLGQLAWSKQMRILAASQSSEFALESGALRHGLLTYALVRDGLDRQWADLEPVDGRVTLSEWFRYGEGRVARLAEEIASGALPAIGGRGPLVVSKAPPPSRMTQTPALFDFVRDAHVLVVSGREDDE